MPLTTIADLLRLLTREPGRPRITWYGDGGERVELSGAVLENWVNKTSNLLVEEFDAQPGTRVLLDLPVHWRTVVWTLAVWRVGACVVVGGQDADVVVTDRPAEHPGARELVVVSLPALARRFVGELPPSAVDAATAVMTYGDQLGWAPPVDPAAPALQDASGAYTHARLGEHSAVLAAPTPSARAAISADDGRATLDGTLTTLGVLGGDGSVVLVSTASLAAHAGDTPWFDALLRSERVTDDLVPPQN